MNEAMYVRCVPTTYLPHNNHNRIRIHSFGVNFGLLASCTRCGCGSDIGSPICLLSQHLSGSLLRLVS